MGGKKDLRSEGTGSRDQRGRTWRRRPSIRSLGLSIGCWLSLATCQALVALPPDKPLHQLRLDVWQADDGLPLGSVIEVLQTSDGYLWLGGYEYLARFDGRRFTIVARTNSPELRGSNVYTLAEAVDGGLWVGTGGGGLTHLGDGVFTTYTRDDGLAHDQVRDLLVDRQGDLWIATYGGGLSHLAGGRFTNYSTDDGLPHDFVWALAEGPEGDLWVGTEGGLARRSAEGWTTYSTEDGLLDPRIKALHFDRQSVLWIGTYGGTLMRYVDGTIEPGFGDGRWERDITSLHEDRDGNLWIGSHGTGLLRLVGGELSRHGPETGLSSDVVWALAEDREGSLWIATEGGGLDRLRDTRFTPWTTRDGLPHDRIWVLEQDLEGALWFGSDGAGLGRMSDGEVRTVGEGSNSGNITALHRAADGGLWVGTDRGLHRMDGERIVSVEAPGLDPEAVVLALWEDRRGELWVGTEISGLQRISGLGGGGGKRGIETYSTEEGLPHTSVRALLEDDEGTMWVGTDGGLVKIVEGELGPPLDVGIVRSIYQDSQGTVWIGTRGRGLARVRGDHVSSFTSRHGLPTDTFYAVLEDGSRNLWMSSNIGILRLERESVEAVLDGRKALLEVELYGTADGMKSVECTGGSQPAGLADSEGRLWFPTAKGLVEIDPENLAPNPLPPPVQIEKVLADGRPIHGTSADTDEPIVLPPSIGQLDFHYTALSLLDPPAVRFKVQLEGYDDDWVDAGSERSARYTNMPPGDYRFRVIAANNDGVWNDIGSSVSFTLLPAFHQTWWFYGLCGILVAGLAMAVHRLLVRRLVGIVTELRTIRGELEGKNEEIERRNDEIEQRNDEMERFIYTVSHDLKSPLLTIQGYVGMMEKDLEAGRPDRLGGDLRRVDRAGNTMNRLLDGLLELSRIGRIMNPPQEASLDAIVHEAVAAVGGQIDRRGVEVVVEEDLGQVYGDTVRLVQVFQNLVANAVKYMGDQDEPRIEIASYASDEGSAVYVRDNGMGIDPADQEKIFGLFGQLDPKAEGTGIGLALVQRIVEVHGGRIWVESEGRGHGSTFCVVLPTCAPSD